jgi:serine/threonine protein kinase
MPSSTPPSEPESPVAQGDVLAGKYRVDSVLGSGGMGVVVAATHMTLRQKVALKFLLPAAAQHAETKERFLREARAAVKLKSEHVAKVVDVGTLEDGAPYMVMEYLDGATLGQIVRGQGAQPIADAVGFVLQACEAVAEAHAAGIVHRDLKPENLFLTRRVDGQPLVKVLDFGIAKDVGADAALSLTRTSTIIGSPLYMPPEQLRSAKAADARSDIWALGAVLFELLTGRVPFTAESFSELCLKVAQDPAPAPSTLTPGVPPQLDAAVLRCLEKDVARRFQNVGEMAEALAPFAPESGREFARRVTSVLAGGSWPPAQRALSASASGAAKAQTGTAWGNTSSEATKRRRRTWMIGAVGLAVGVAGMVFVVRPWSSGAQGVAPSTSAQSASAAVSPFASASSIAPTSTASVVLATPSTDAPRAPSASAAPSSSQASVLRPHTGPGPGAPPGPAVTTTRPPGTTTTATGTAATATAGGDIVFQRK